ncbi:MAG: hypothetical protein Q9225_005052 [Loekoesia sp. 1 TL-2023]
MAVQGTSGFSCLPTELQAMICAYLPESDLLNWRLVSRSLGAVGAQYLLPTVHLYFENSGFARLQQIFKNPTVCSGVHSLQYNVTSFIPSLRNVEDWKQFLLEIGEGPQLNPPMPTAQNQNIADWDPTIKQLHQRLWTLLKNPSDFSADQFVQDFTTTTAGLQQLKYLSLEIDARGWDHYQDDDGRIDSLDYNGTVAFDESPYANDYLQNGRVIKFLSSAPNLEYLSTQWTFLISGYLELKYFVGIHTWPNLRSLTLSSISTADADLRHFLKRHAGTLEELNFSDIHLNDGLWAPVFLFMRLELSLRAFRTAWLRGMTDEDIWVKDKYGFPIEQDDQEEQGEPGEDEGDELCSIIYYYVTGTGHAPLLHPQQKRHDEYLVDDGNGGLTVLTE